MTDTRSALQIRKDVIAMTSKHNNISEYAALRTERDRLRTENAELRAVLNDLLIWADAPGVAVKPGYVADKARAAIAKANT